MKKVAETDHPIEPSLQERWSPRAFDARDVEAEHLRSLLEAARWAPSSYNEQPWAFLVARRSEPDEFQRLLECLVEGNRLWAKNAAVLLLSVVSTRFERNGKPNRHASHDVGLATANLTVQATHLGLSVHQMAGFDVEQARKTYAIPEGWEPLTAIAIGHRGDPDTLALPLREKEEAPRQRKPQREFVFCGTFGRVSPWVGT